MHLKAEVFGQVDSGADVQDSGAEMASGTRGGQVVGARRLAGQDLRPLDVVIAALPGVRASAL